MFSTTALIVDTPDDLELPIILGKPFLETSKVLIDVEIEELVLRTHYDFHIFEAAYKEPPDKKWQN